MLRLGYEPAPPKACSLYTMGKHPLSHAWTLWYYRNDRTRSWELNQSPILSFQTVEDFWSLYNHLELASKLPTGSDYSVFKVNPRFAEMASIPQRLTLYLNFNVRREIRRNLSNRCPEKAHKGSAESSFVPGHRNIL